MAAPQNIFSGCSASTLISCAPTVHQACTGHRKRREKSPQVTRARGGHITVYHTPLLRSNSIPRLQCAEWGSYYSSPHFTEVGLKFRGNSSFLKVTITGALRLSLFREGHPQAWKEGPGWPGLLLSGLLPAQEWGLARRGWQRRPGAFPAEANGLGT